MEEECPICGQIFIAKLRQAIKLCPHQHFCCLECYIQLLEHQKHQCPECRYPIKPRHKTFQLFQLSVDKLEEVSSKYSQDIRQLKCSIQLVINELMKFEGNIEANAIIRLKAMKLMKDGNFESAAELLMHIIQNNFEAADCETFIGLGSREQQIGLSEGCGMEWFTVRYGEISLLDAVGLCFLFNSQYGKQREWYQMMRHRYPGSYKLCFELALVEHNAENYEAAKFLYNEAISLNDSFSKSFQMLAFLNKDHVETELQVEYADKCLQRENNNIFALLIKAKHANYQNLDSLLANILEIEPEYVRAIYQIKYEKYVLNKLNFSSQSSILLKEETINVFKHIISINKLYLQPYFYLVQYSTSAFQQIYQYIQPVIAILNLHLTNKQRSDCYILLGNIYQKCSDKATANQAYMLAYKIDMTNTLAYYNHIKYVINSKYFQFAIQIFEEYVDLFITGIYKDKVYDNVNNPTWKVSIYFLGFIAYFHNRQYEQAQTWLQEQRKLNDNQQLQFMSGACNYHLGRLSEALEQFYACINSEWRVIKSCIYVLRILAHQGKQAEKLSALKQYQRRPEFIQQQKEQLRQAAFAQQ